MTGASRWARAAVTHVAGLSSGPPLDRSLRITLNFHPDRGPVGDTVVDRLAREGIYRNQFETGTSNGGLTAHVGGDRFRCEAGIFGSAYDDAPASERPRYGALNHRRRGVGGAVRFGSSHLRLAEHVLDRATFCFPDSFREPSDFGTARRFALLPLADAFDSVVAQCRSEQEEAEQGGILDDYVEAHVHGVVALAEDVEAVVLDPAYRGTEVEESAMGLGVPVEWHEGRVLTLSELERRRSYRDPDATAVGRAIARDGLLDAAIIGAAARTGRHHPQSIKQLWHLTARFGRPTHDWLTTTHDWGTSIDHGHLAEQRARAAAQGGVSLRHLLLEVLAYPSDEAQALGRRGRAVVAWHADGSVEISDDGRGTDTRRDDAGRVVRKPVMATPDVRFVDPEQAPRLADGLPRAGMSSVSAVSRWLVHTNRRGDGTWSQRYDHGAPTTLLTEVDDPSPHGPPGSVTGTSVRFLPDPTYVQHVASDRHALDAHALDAHALDAHVLDLRALGPQTWLDVVLHDQR
ncbi:DUF3626 domain-containing protein [Arsenicicoccus sp. oral taxon 190]|uniref:DUF3626 domain-containing protein n=1 Tax=Arsenicicoccus sp. oral taxon 190 TaxID=1658671 RepID=UPI000B07374D|nr:DUF3626 domain-containing protein [Arsenicicoccus sp. oral taxon 190]